MKVVNAQKLPLLVAFHEHSLSPEAADQMVSMLENPNRPEPFGEELPKADRDAVLQKLAKSEAKQKRA